MDDTVRYTPIWKEVEDIKIEYAKLRQSIEALHGAYKQLFEVSKRHSDELVDIRERIQSLLKKVENEK